MSNKHIQQQDQWGEASSELSSEVIKLASYDRLLLKKLGDLVGVKILDYGCGPGVLLKELNLKGANAYGFDVSEKLIIEARKQLSSSRLFTTLDFKNNFDVIICNLVLCIVDETEVEKIMNNVSKLLKPNGRVYVGFCNPKIFNIEESQLDFREKTNCTYCDNHEYTKTKKEGGYTIIEKHRPIEWYRNVYKKAGFKIAHEHYTEKYRCNGCEVEDFIIFELTN